jgi:hypothetical protein
VAALKARPDPPMPPDITVALARHWVWDEGCLWSQQILFGACARETWNDSPGCGAGWTDPEAEAWVNINAFVARLTAQRVRNFTTYVGWAMNAALPEPRDGDDGSKEVDVVSENIGMAGHNPPPSAEVAARVMFRTVEAWLKVAGSYLWKEMKRVGDVDEADYAIGGRIGVRDWRRWESALEKEIERARYGNEVTEIAMECLRVMKDIEEHGEPAGDVVEA